ncbi:MAG: metal-dependent hydrolase [Methanomicrobiaceae archaeon]|nr:metal-dependent hydrolase [Methanomicrobiaceae archaeon]
MLIEHILYSTAVAIPVGMISLRLTGRDPSWIIILCAWAPDIDQVLYPLSYRLLGVSMIVNGHTLRHGDLHTLGALLVFSVLFALVLRMYPFSIRYGDGMLFSGIGYAVHLLGDALVYNPAYPFFWPLSESRLGLGVVFYVRDFFGIADSRVLVVGLLLCALAVLVRTAVDGRGWTRHYMFWRKPENT